MLVVALEEQTRNAFIGGGIIVAIVIFVIIGYWPRGK